MIIKVENSMPVLSIHPKVKSLETTSLAVRMPMEFGAPNVINIQAMSSSSTVPEAPIDHKIIQFGQYTYNY